jgi:hypothetical protein
VLCANSGFQGRGHPTIIISIQNDEQAVTQRVKTLIFNTLRQAEAAGREKLRELIGEELGVGDGDIISWEVNRPFPTLFGFCPKDAYLYLWCEEAQPQLRVDRTGRVGCSLSRVCWCVSRSAT